MARALESAQSAVLPGIFTSPREDSDLEFRVTVTASVPGESNHDVGPRGVQPRCVESRPVESRAGAFPRSARLLRHADFERVYKQGRRHFSASMTVFYWPRPEAAAKVSGLRVGFTVSRALGGAVQRNRMKRRLREAVRIAWPATQPATDVVINPKKSLLTVEFTAVVNEVRRAFVIIEKASTRYPVPSTQDRAPKKPEA